SPNTAASEEDVFRVSGGVSPSASSHTTGSSSALASTVLTPSTRTVQSLSHVSPAARRLSNSPLRAVVKNVGAARPRGNFGMPAGLPPQIGYRLVASRAM